MVLFSHEKYLIVCEKEWVTALVRDISHAIRYVCLLRCVYLLWNDRTASAMISPMLRRIATTNSASNRRSDRGLFLQLHSKRVTHINHQILSWALSNLLAFLYIHSSKLGLFTSSGAKYWKAECIVFGLL
jgi:hypothetical protein